MSFGWSVGDILAAGQLIWKISQALRNNNAEDQYQKSSIAAYFVATGLNEVALILEETETAGGAVANDIKKQLSQLDPSLERLTQLIDKGQERMVRSPALEPSRKWERYKEWPHDQIFKLDWFFNKHKEVEAILEDIRHIIASLNPVLLRLHARTTNNILKDDIASRSAWMERMERMMVFVVQNCGRLPVGPEAGIMPDAIQAPKTSAQTAILDLESSLSLIEGLEPTVMDSTYAQNIKHFRADYHVKNKLASWLAGDTSARLYLSGDKAKDASAIVFQIARERRRPAIAFTMSRQDWEGVQRSEQQGAKLLIFSLLYQVVGICREREGDLIVTPTVWDHDFRQLESSSDPVIPALHLLKAFMDRIPQCVVIVDNWNVLAMSQDIQVLLILERLMNLFEPKPSAYRHGRLLITSKWHTLSPPSLAAMDSTELDRMKIDQYVNQTGKKLVTSLNEILW